MTRIPKPEKTALIVFAKRPRHGQGKQRLAAEIGAETAFKIAETLLKQTLEMVEKWSGTLIVSPASVEDSEWACELLKRPIICIVQREGDLGERLERIDSEVRMLGYTNLIFIGTDAPLLSVSDLETVSTALNQYSQAFIPAQDGGVVLMATSVPWQGLAKVEWSTEKVFDQLKSLAIAQGLNVRILAEQVDLDDMASFQNLKISIDRSSYSSLLQEQLIEILTKYE